MDDTMSDTTVVKNYVVTQSQNLRKWFLSSREDVLRFILVLSLICTVGALLEMRLKDFLIPLPVMLFLLGSGIEILSFFSHQVQAYVDTIQWMSPKFVFGIFTPIIIFNVAFRMDVHMIRKLTWQIIFITIPGFVLNYILILWYLSSVNTLPLKTMPWLLFSIVLYSSDPMLTAASVRNLGLSRSLVNLISGESLMNSIISFMLFSTILKMNTNMQETANYSLSNDIVGAIETHFLASLVTGLISSKLIQLLMVAGFGDDINHLSFSVAISHVVFYIWERTGMSGILAVAIMGLFFNSTRFKPRLEALLVQLWECLSFVSFVMVFTFTGLLIPAKIYLYITFSDICFSLHMYFTLIALRLLVILLISPILSRLGNGFNWSWAFIMVLSEMRGTPNINMAFLLAYDSFTGTEREKAQMLFHGVSVCLITLIVNKFLLPLAVTKLTLPEVTSTKRTSLYYIYKYFQELTKSTASKLKLDKDLANADWNTVEKAMAFQNPYEASQETKGHQMVKCTDCNKEIDETLNTEEIELANRRLLSAQMASYQRQYRNETLTQSALQLLLGAAGSVGEEKGRYMSPETIKNYFESKNLLFVMRKLLLNWVYNVRRERGSPSKYCLLRLCHKIVFSDEFEYVGYLVVLMNLFPITITWIPVLNKIYEKEITKVNYFFLGIYILEALFKMAAMRMKYFLHTWNLFDLIITFVDIIDQAFASVESSTYQLGVIKTMVFIKIIRGLRVLRLFKLVTPKLLLLIDKRMSQQLSLRYAVLKGYVQGEEDVMTVIDHISNSKQIKQMLLKRVAGNIGRAMKELGYFECDHPEITIPMKTKEQINVMLNIATEIVEDFRLKGIIHEIEGAEVNKLIMAKKREMLDFQPTVHTLTVEEALYNIPWLDKEHDHIAFIREKVKVMSFDCGNDIFEEGDEPKGIYIIISGMVKLKGSKPSLGNDQILWESEEKDSQTTYVNYTISGEILGELSCLTNEPMKYSATCKTLVEACFIPRKHLLDAFEHCCPVIEYKMWLKFGLSIAAKKLRENLPYEDWNYKMQLQLSNSYIKDVPRHTKTDIYDEAVIYVVLIHGAVEDCRFRKAYTAPSLIPITCHQVQGTENFTKIMILQTAIDEKKFKGSTEKYVPTCKHSLRRQSIAEDASPTGGLLDTTNINEE